VNKRILVGLASSFTKLLIKPLSPFETSGGALCAQAQRALLKASLTFSPACLTFDFALSGRIAARHARWWAVGDAGDHEGMSERSLRQTYEAIISAVAAADRDAWTS
jgi:hypothetical protein